MVIVGTKLDLRNEREVTRETIQELAARWGVPVYETSAKRNWQVSAVFEDLLRQMRIRYRMVDTPVKRPAKRHRRCIVM